MQREATNDNPDTTTRAGIGADAAGAADDHGVGAAQAARARDARGGGGVDQKGDDSSQDARAARDAGRGADVVWMSLRGPRRTRAARSPRLGGGDPVPGPARSIVVPERLSISGADDGGRIIMLAAGLGIGFIAGLLAAIATGV